MTIFIEAVPLIRLETDRLISDFNDLVVWTFRACPHNGARCARRRPPGPPYWLRRTKDICTRYCSVMVKKLRGFNQRTGITVLLAVASLIRSFIVVMTQSKVVV